MTVDETVRMENRQVAELKILGYDHANAVAMVDDQAASLSGLPGTYAFGIRLRAQERFLFRMRCAVGDMHQRRGVTRAGVEIQRLCGEIEDTLRRCGALLVQ